MGVDHPGGASPGISSPVDCLCLTSARCLAPGMSGVGHPVPLAHARLTDEGPQRVGTASSSDREAVVDAALGLGIGQRLLHLQQPSLEHVRVG
jgi:hypothetical protein